MFALNLFVKVLPFLWPFIREMVFGKKSVFQAFRDNKKKVLFVLLIITSFAFNFFTVPRLYSITVEYIALDKKYKELQNKYAALGSSTKHTFANGSEVQIPVKPPEHTVPPGEAPVKHTGSNVASPANAEIERARQDFERMQKREENEH